MNRLNLYIDIITHKNKPECCKLNVLHSQFSLMSKLCISIHRKRLEQVKQDTPGWAGETTEKQISSKMHIWIEVFKYLHKKAQLDCPLFCLWQYLGSHLWHQCLCLNQACVCTSHCQHNGLSYVCSYLRWNSYKSPSVVTRTCDSFLWDVQEPWFKGGKRTHAYIRCKIGYLFLIFLTCQYFF